MDVPEPAHVEERLVDRQPLDERRVVLEDAVDRLARLGVGRHARRHDDGVRAEPPRRAPAHRRADRRTPSPRSSRRARRRRRRSPACRAAADRRAARPTRRTSRGRRAGSSARSPRTDVRTMQPICQLSRRLTAVRARLATGPDRGSVDAAASYRASERLTMRLDLPDLSTARRRRRIAAVVEARGRLPRAQRDRARLGGAREVARVGQHAELHVALDDRRSFLRPSSQTRKRATTLHADVAAATGTRSTAPCSSPGSASGSASRSSARRRWGRTTRSRWSSRSSPSRRRACGDRRRRCARRSSRAVAFVTSTQRVAGAVAALPLNANELAPPVHVPESAVSSSPTTRGTGDRRPRLDDGRVVARHHVGRHRGGGRLTVGVRGRHDDAQPLVDVGVGRACTTDSWPR